MSPEEAEVVNNRLPLLVVVDNLPSGARPQYGLDAADMVWELLVEGGITRYSAVYHRRDAGWIEPVRSVRTPILYIASELDATIVHIGASETTGPSDARSQMRLWSLRNFEESREGYLFWRDRNRYAPHNAATSTGLVWGESDRYEWGGPGLADRWYFKDDWEVANQTLGLVGRCSFGFGGIVPVDYSFWVDWTYDPSFNGYWRSLGGYPHRDGLSGAVLTAKNVVIGFYDARVLNREGHVEYDPVGEGPAYVLLDGQVIDATWTKRWREDRTRLWDPTGAEVLFNRGTTWFAMLPYGSPLTWE